MNLGEIHPFTGNLHEIRQFVGKSISWDLIYRKKENAEMKMKKFMNDVCKEAFNVIFSNGIPSFVAACQFLEPRMMELAYEHLQAQEAQENQDQATKQQIEEFFVR